MGIVIIAVPALAFLLLLLYALARISKQPTPPQTPVDRYRDAEGPDEWFERSHGGSD
jgi:hypothetical protein